MTDLCPHGDKDWRCPTCCLAELRRNTPRLEKAVRNADKTISGGSSSPGFGSRVPAGFSVSAFSLLQDIRQHGGLDIIEKQLNTMRDPERLTALRKTLRQWRSRASLILRDALAPYPLTWDTPVPQQDGTDRIENRPVPCPVVDEYGDCGHPLLVHRDNDPGSPNYGKAAVIRCRARDDHEWPLAHGGWLRLGVLLALAEAEVRFGYRLAGGAV